MNLEDVRTLIMTVKIAMDIDNTTLWDSRDYMTTSIIWIWQLGKETNDRRVSLFIGSCKTK